jgi:hypothetical protein
MPQVSVLSQFNNTFEHIPSGVKASADILSFSVILGTLFNHLPSIAAGLSIVWSAIRIYETRTVRSLLAKLQPRFTRLIARFRRTPDNSN